jgi:hypothetical protein
MAETMTMNGASEGIELDGNAGRDDGSIAYVSPTVNGIHARIDVYVQRFTVMYIVKRKIKDWRLP